jgi:hypothetical protein
VHLYEALRNQPNPEAALRAIQGAIALNEQFKYVRKQLGGNAGAIVSDRQDAFNPFVTRFDADLAVRL